MFQPQAPLPPQGPPQGPPQHPNQASFDILANTEMRVDPETMRRKQEARQSSEQRRAMRQMRRASAAGFAPQQQQQQQQQPPTLPLQLPGQRPIPPPPTMFTPGQRPIPPAHGGNQWLQRHASRQPYAMRQPHHPSRGVLPPHMMQPQQRGAGALQPWYAQANAYANESEGYVTNPSRSSALTHSVKDVRRARRVQRANFRRMTVMSSAGFEALSKTVGFKEVDSFGERMKDFTQTDDFVAISRTSVRSMPTGGLASMFVNASGILASTVMDNISGRRYKPPKKKKKKKKKSKKHDDSDDDLEPSDVDSSSSEEDESSSSEEDESSSEEDEDESSSEEDDSRSSRSSRSSRRSKRSHRSRRSKHSKKKRSSRSSRKAKSTRTAPVQQQPQQQQHQMPSRAQSFHPAVPPDRLTRHQPTRSAYNVSTLEQRPHQQHIPMNRARTVGVPEPMPKQQHTSPQARTVGAPASNASTASSAPFHLHMPHKSTPMPSASSSVPSEDDSVASRRKVPPPPKRKTKTVDGQRMVKNDDGTWRPMMDAPPPGVMSAVSGLGESVIPKMVEHMEETQAEAEEQETLDNLAPKPTDDFA